MANKKGYQNEDSASSSQQQSQQQQRRRDGHLLRLWAEVFHVSAASGAIRWQQVTQDLVPVNISCIQDSPECVFQVTAYSSRVEKILDTHIAQPGTRLGQASECFIYWKDTSTGDTWGLNFTSPEDAKQFRILCSPSFKISRKASSSYSLRVNEPPSKRNERSNLAVSGKRKPQSTPSSPSRRGYSGNELQCTCMNIAEAIQRQRNNGRVRYTGSSTIPRTVVRPDGSQIATYPSNMSVQNAAASGSQQPRGTVAGVRTAAGQMSQGAVGRQQAGRSAVINGHIGDTNVPRGQAMAHQQHIRNAQYSRANYAQSARKEQARSMDSTVYPYDARASSINRPLTAEPHLGHPHHVVVQTHQGHGQVRVISLIESVFSIDA